jgi:hypothetical protein
MNSVHREGGCWPTRQQELLLRAALLQGEEAINAWYEWKSKVDVDRIDQGSLRLLPLLYQNLCVLGIEDPLMDIFKGVYRLTWYKNQTVLHDMAFLLNAFHNAGIQTMVLKGTALTLLHYRDYGLRPMHDFDVLIQTEQVSAAIDLLKRLDWRPKSRELKAFNKEYFSLRHSHGFEDNSGRQFDLHWYMFPECCFANSNDDFWNGSVSTEFHNVAVHALNPTDQLLHVCVHGINWAPVPLPYWIADAMVLMNTSQSEIDWDRLIAQTQRLRLILPIKDSLNYIQDLLHAPIPPAFLESLKSTPVSRLERMEYHTRTRPPGVMGGLPIKWFRYLRYSHPTNNPVSLFNFIGFSRFLQHYWGIDHLWQVPFHVVSKGVKRAWKQ